MSADIDISVVIPHYNDVARLRRCLDALAPQVDETVEVMVADNASPVSLDDVFQDFPWARLTVQPEKGAGLARNAGVRASSGRWIMFIDADCIPAIDWIDVGRRIRRDGYVIGGRVDVFDETPPPRSGAEAFETVFAFHMEAYFKDKAFLGSGNLITTRAVFEKTGPFRAGVSEDVEWSQRAARSGAALGFERDFAVSHPSRPDWPALKGKWRRLTSENFLLEGEVLTSRVRRVLRALAMAPSILVHLPKVLTHPDLSRVEKLRGAGTLARLRIARMIWMMGQAFTGRP